MWCMMLLLFALTEMPEKRTCVQEIHERLVIALAEGHGNMCA